jgi:hypothetical protein
MPNESDQQPRPAPANPAQSPAQPSQAQPSQGQSPRPHAPEAQAETRPGATVHDQQPQPFTDVSTPSPNPGRLQFVRLIKSFQGSDDQKAK